MMTGMRHHSTLLTHSSLLRCHGFTLVELLLVISLLGSLALVATVFVDNANQQLGFDQTKSRMEQIRRAIIGDTSRTLNGQPDLSGFIVDIGRLPNCLRELIDGKCADGDPEPNAWTPLGFVAPPSIVGELYGGWRGPYLEAMAESTGIRAFRDGWGNQGQVNAPANSDYDSKQFGWKFQFKDASDADTSDPVSAVGLFLQSLGSDLAVGTTDVENPYHADYPVTGNLVATADWEVDIRSLVFQLQINGTVATDEAGMKLRIYYLRDDPTVAGINVEYAEYHESDAFSLIAGENPLVDVVFPNPIDPLYLPMGRHMAVLVCGDDTAYDGNCGASNVPPFTFTFLPRSQLPTIQWNIL